MGMGKGSFNSCQSRVSDFKKARLAFLKLKKVKVKKIVLESFGFWEEELCQRLMHYESSLGPHPPFLSVSLILSFPPFFAFIFVLVFVLVFVFVLSLSLLLYLSLYVRV